MNKASHEDRHEARKSEQLHADLKIASWERDPDKGMNILSATRKSWARNLERKTRFS